ncbi:putative transcription factor NAM family [Helianthus annuus]|nr:putative transcription factor NAM family [Helianthus annuus]
MLHSSDKSSLKSGDLEWYFFCPKSKKDSGGVRANRATETGFWKGTGKDRYVEYRGRTVATIKTLVFYLGRAKDGKRTDWVLHEYRMDDKQLADAGVIQGQKNGAEYGAPFNEDEWDDDLVSSIDSQAVVGLVGVSITTDHKQTQPGSSIVTISATEPTSTLNYKQEGLATTNIAEPGTSGVTLSATEPTNIAEPGTSGVTLPEAQILKSVSVESIPEVHETPILMESIQEVPEFPILKMIPVYANDPCFLPPSFGIPDLDYTSLNLIRHPYLFLTIESSDSTSIMDPDLEDLTYPMKPSVL